MADGSHFITGLHWMATRQEAIVTFSARMTCELSALNVTLIKEALLLRARIIYLLYPDIQDATFFKDHSPQLPQNIPMVGESHNKLSSEERRIWSPHGHPGTLLY